MKNHTAIAVWPMSLSLGVAHDQRIEAGRIPESLPLTGSAHIGRKCSFGGLMDGDRVMDAFATRLRADRNRIGLTVRQLAEQTGISFSYITKIETGRAGKGISPAIVTTLAESLQSDVLEYLSLSRVVPSPLDQLIADKQSREFLHRLLSLNVDASGWDRLQRVLAEATESHVTTNLETPMLFEKPKRDTAEQKCIRGWQR